MIDSDNRMTDSLMRTAKRPSFVASGFLKMIAFYQRYLSPARPACCRFTPTCSAYAATAIRQHGAIKGGGLALWRLLRCQPFSKGGYDPVPDVITRGQPVRRKEV